ncbi:MAG: hypothetical protein ACKV2Q_27005 [Planctomycetaceae bacterium]
MSINAGVWIDHRRAVVVRMTDNGEEIKTIQSHANRPFASAAGGGSKQPERPSGYQSEDKQERKFMDQLGSFYDEVLKSLRDANSVLILGPGEAKGEFKKHLNTKKFPVLVADVETADKMTDREIAASVRQHFEEVSLLS